MVTPSTSKHRKRMIYWSEWTWSERLGAGLAEDRKHRRQERSFMLCSKPKELGRWAPVCYPSSVIPHVVWHSSLLVPQGPNGQSTKPVQHVQCDQALQPMPCMLLELTKPSSRFGAVNILAGPIRRTEARSPSESLTLSGRLYRVSIRALRCEPRRGGDAGASAPPPRSGLRFQQRQPRPG